jgi:hypothetical protein
MSKVQAVINNGALVLKVSKGHNIGQLFSPQCINARQTHAIQLLPTAAAAALCRQCCGLR